MKLRMVTYTTVSERVYIRTCYDNSYMSSAVTATLFFLTYWVYMVYLTWLVPQYGREEQRPSTFAYFVRNFCVLVATVALVVTAYISAHWNSESKLEMAMCEW